jgi:hypothetical protein
MMNREPRKVTFTVTVPGWLRVPRWVVLVWMVVLVTASRIDVPLQVLQYFLAR